jgi:hypothetical protein
MLEVAPPQQETRPQLQQAHEHRKNKMPTSRFKWCYCIQRLSQSEKAIRRTTSVAKQPRRPVQSVIKPTFGQHLKSFFRNVSPDTDYRNETKSGENG